MKCPNCQIEFEHRATADFEVDECPSCRSLWFDPRRIEDIKDKMASDLRWLEFSTLGQHGEFHVNHQSMPCPACKDAYLTAVYDPGTEASIQFCPRCEGVWLKIEDLLKITASMNREVNRLDVSEYIRSSLQQVEEIFSTKNRTISEWRDLKAVLRLLKYRVFVENPKLNSVMMGLQKSLPL